MMSWHRINFLMDFHLYSAFSTPQSTSHSAIHGHIHTLCHQYMRCHLLSKSSHCSHTDNHTFRSNLGFSSHNNGIKTTYMESQSRPFEGNKTLKKSIYLPTPLFIMQKWNFCKGDRALLVHFPFTRSSNRHMTQKATLLIYFVKVLNSSTVVAIIVAVLWSGCCCHYQPECTLCLFPAH